MSRTALFIPIASFGLAAGCATGTPVADAMHPAAAPADAALAAGLPSVVRHSGVASVSVAHVEDGRIVALEAAGLRAPGEATTVDTRYNVASLTKPVSAEVALRLVAEGRFALDHPMADAWVDPDIADDPRHRDLTPRLALNHQAGFPNWRGPDGLRFERDPGDGTGYSGEGYEYVASYIDRDTGAAIDKHAQRLLFEPLGMAATSYTPRGTPSGDIAGSRSGVTWAVPVTRSAPSAADDLVTTAGDYARFLVSLMQGEGLTPALSAERGRVQADRLAETCEGIPDAACPEAAGFALGWEMFVIDGTPYYMHTGADDDGFSLAYWTPATRSGTVILTNSPDGHRAVLPVLDLVGADPAFVALLRAQASR